MKRFTKANGGYSAVNGQMERFNSMNHHYLCSNRGVFPSTETFHSFHWRSQNVISIGDRSQLGTGTNWDADVNWGQGCQLGTGTNWDADVCIPQGFLQSHLYLGLFWPCRSDLD